MVKMELPASQSQSAGTQSATVELVEAIQGLTSALNQVNGIANFKGVAASKAKEYGQSYIVPAATAAETLVKGVVQDVAKLTQKYMSDVDGKSHDSEKLKEQMQQIAMAQAALDSAADTAKAIPDKGISGAIVSALQGKMSANDAKSKKYKKLYDDFMKYDGGSTDIFSDLDDLESAFNTGINEILKGFNKSAGTYGEFDTSQSRAWTVAASNDEQEIQSKRNLNMSKDGKSFGDYLFTGENAVDAGLNGTKEYKERKSDVLNKEAGKEHKSGEFATRSMEHQAVKDTNVSGFSELAGKAFTGAMAAKDINDDLNDGKTVGQSMSHVGIGIAAGEAGSAIAGAAVAGIASLGIDLPVLVAAGLVVGGGIVLSSIYNFAYDHSKTFHNFINGIGNFLDKEIINPRNKVYKEQGQSVMKYEVYPY